MVKNTSTTAARRNDNPTSFRSDHASTKQSQQFNRVPADDIILSLANAYENKRARQVTEWERAQAVRMSRAA